MSSFMKDLINRQGIVALHQPDGSVIMNDDIHLTPDMPKDDDGFVWGENDRVSVGYNFETRSGAVTHKGRILWGRVYASIALLVIAIVAVAVIAML